MNELNEEEMLDNEETTVVETSSATKAKVETSSATKAKVETSSATKAKVETASIVDTMDKAMGVDMKKILKKNIKHFAV